MGEKLQKIVSFAWGGIMELWNQCLALILMLHHFFDDLLLYQHNICAWILVGVILFFIAFCIWSFVKPRRAVPTEVAKMMKTKEVRTPKPYRLLGFWVAVGVIFLAACFHAM